MWLKSLTEMFFKSLTINYYVIIAIIPPGYHQPAELVFSQNELIIFLRELTNPFVSSSKTEK